MPRACTICRHEQRRAIDQALIAGTPYRRIATAHGVSPMALVRHKADHLLDLMARSKAAELVEAGDLMAQLVVLRQKAISLLLKAEGMGDYRTALLGVREARQTLELIAEIEGKLASRRQVTIIGSPQFNIVVTLLMQELGPYPELRATIAEKLAALDAGD